MTRQLKEPSHGRHVRRRVALAGTMVAVAVAGGGAALSAQGDGVARAAGAARRATGSAASGRSSGYSPQTLQRAYGVSPLLRSGVDGGGETVVLPEAASPVLFDIRRGLAALDTRDHLRPVDLTLTRAPGYTGEVSGADGEEVEDAEIVHAIAPAAKITVMLAGLHAFVPRVSASLLHAAAGRGNVVSLSYGACERCLSAGQRRSLHSALRYACDRHVGMSPRPVTPATRTLTVSWAFSTRGCTGSATAPSATGRFTTSPAEPTPSRCPRAHESTATARDAAGIRSPAGARRTPQVLVPLLGTAVHPGDGRGL